MKAFHGIAIFDYRKISIQKMKKTKGKNLDKVFLSNLWTDCPMRFIYVIRGSM
jgi:hypothetical protein